MSIHVKRKLAAINFKAILFGFLFLLSQLTTYSQVPIYVPQLNNIGNVNCLRVSNNGEFLVTGSEMGEVKIWDLRSKLLMKTLHYSSIKQVEISHDDKYIGILGSNAIFLISVDSLAQIRYLADLHYTGFKFLKNENKIVALSQASMKIQSDRCYYNKLIVYDVTKEKSIKELEYPFCDYVPGDIEISRDNKTIITIGDENKLKIFSYSLLKKVDSFSIGNRSISAICFNDKTKEIYLAGHQIDSIIIFNLDNKKISGYVPLEKESNLKKLAVSNNGNHLLVTTGDARLIIFNTVDWSTKFSKKDSWGSHACTYSTIDNMFYASWKNKIYSISPKLPEMEVVLPIYVVQTKNRYVPTSDAITSFDTLQKCLVLNDNNSLTYINLRDCHIVNEDRVSTDIHHTLFFSPFYKEYVYVSTSTDTSRCFIKSKQNGSILDYFDLPDNLEKNIMMKFIASDGNKFYFIFSDDKLTGDFEEIKKSLSNQSIFRKRHDYLVVVDLSSSNKAHLIDRGDYISCAASPLGNFFIIQKDYNTKMFADKVDHRFELYRTGKKKPFKTWKSHDSMNFTKKMLFLNEDEILLLQDFKVYKYWISKDSLTILTRIESAWTNQCTVYGPHLLFYSTDGRSSLFYYNLLSGQLKKLKSLETAVRSSCFIDSNNIAIWDGNGAISIRAISDDHDYATWSFIDNNAFIVNTDSAYYFMTGNSPKNLGFLYQGRMYGIEQFDFKYNRPDKVLERLGYSDKNVVQKYRNAYKLRLEKSNISDISENDSNEFPVVKIINRNSIKPKSSDRVIDVSIEVSTSQTPLKSVNLHVNGVPCYVEEATGKRLVKKIIPVTLNIGQNKIQVFARNVKGFVSFKETVYTEYISKDHQPNLYLMGLAISAYAHADTLPNTDKDLRKLVKCILERNATEKLYSNIFIDTLINQLATPKAFFDSCKKLRNSSVDDVVIIYYGGHGLRKDSLLYLTTYHTNFDSIQENSIEYGTFEKVIENIGSRKKLLLINSCYAGEYDKDMDNFNVMKTFFPDFRNQDGSVVIASAESQEVARATRGDFSSNTIFGEALLKGLRKQSYGDFYNADEDQNGFVTVNELFVYLNKRVSTASKELQNVNFRKENPELNFRIW